MSIDAENTCDRIQNPLLKKKSLNKIEIEENFLSLMKGIYLRTYN